jgi:hypothetical protein
MMMSSSVVTRINASLVSRPHTRPDRRITYVVEAVAANR